MTLPLSTIWAQKFGLAESPLFGGDASQPEGRHVVMLDGGIGSFNLSTSERFRDPSETASWAWSCNIPHHVAVNDDSVQVVRWDAPHTSEVYLRETVEANLTEFYRYLRKDRVRSNLTVVKHLLTTFSRLRSLLADRGVEDTQSTNAFVAILADQISNGESSASPTLYGLNSEAIDVFHRLGSDGYASIVDGLHSIPVVSDALKLHSSLVVRHASGQLFQEAHFDLVRSGQRNLFGEYETSTTSTVTRGGIHFTPPSLARSIVDFIFAKMPDLKSKSELTLLDPACGSGAFLHEAIRGLQRVGFRGRLEVLGQDLSPAAITMAKFTIAMAFRDWTPAGGASFEIRLKDSLDTRLPDADVIVMNPPYISRVAQTAKQKQQLDEIVGAQSGRRGDYSMAFVTHALSSLKPGGTIGVLVPTSLLRLKAALPWRQQVAEMGDIDLIADIGDFSLFSEALVNVAIIVASNRSPRRDEFLAMVSGNDPETTGDAFRHLRLVSSNDAVEVSDGNSWSLFTESDENLTTSTDWKILTPREREVLRSVNESIETKVSDLFRVERGIETGNLKAFVIDKSEFLTLPKSERKFFRSTLNTNAINGGSITDLKYVFYPYDSDGPIFQSEEMLLRNVPVYANRRLFPSKKVLQNRAAFRRERRPDWWGLNWHRAYTLNRQPKILSKFFGKEGSFVFDPDGSIVITTGHVWLPIEHRFAEITSGDEISAELLESVNLEVLQAYKNLLNSESFMRLVSLYSPSVAGGQYDLSKRFVDNISLPDLWEKYFDPIEGEAVRRLSTLKVDEEGARRTLENLVAKVYMVPSLG